MISMVDSSRLVCSCKGSATFSPTVIDPKSAPPWNDIPIFFNNSSRSPSDMDAKSLFCIQISPELGISSPTKVRSSVLLPDPEPPRITSVSPAGTSKLIPCRISRSPYFTRRLRTDIAEDVVLFFDAGVGVVGLINNLPWRRQIENCRKNQINNNHQKNGLHHGRCRRTPHLFGSQPRRKAFLATNCRDHQPEHRGLQQTGHDVALQQ